MLDLLPERIMLTTTAPTAGKAIDILTDFGILRETTGKPRDRVFVYQSYLRVLTGHMESGSTS